MASASMAGAMITMKMPAKMPAAFAAWFFLSISQSKATQQPAFDATPLSSSTRLAQARAPTASRGDRTTTAALRAATAKDAHNASLMEAAQALAAKDATHAAQEVRAPCSRYPEVLTRFWPTSSSAGRASGTRS